MQMVWATWAILAAKQKYSLKLFLPFCGMEIVKKKHPGQQLYTFAYIQIYTCICEKKVMGHRGSVMVMIF